MTESREHDRIGEEIVRTEKSSDPFAAAVRATRMPMLITDPSQPDNPIVFVNDAFSKLTGYERDYILGKNCRFLQGPKTDKGDVKKIKDSIARRVPVEVELLNHKRNGEVFWNRLLISPVFDADGQLVYFFASQFDVTLERDRLVRLQSDRDALELEVERRAGDLLRSEQRLQFLLKAGHLGTWTLELSDRRLVTSDVCKQNFGRGLSDPFTYEDLLTALHPEDQQRMQDAVQESIAQRHEYRIEYRVITPDLQVRWVQIIGQPFYRADGEPISMSGVSIDITDRKRAEEHQALMADELNHRVKNSMATMQSIVHQTLRHAPSMDEARKILDARLNSLATAHDVLTRESWEGALVGEIADQALKPFRSELHDRIKAGGPKLKVNPRVALALSMTLHELATNATKYGALSNEQGSIILNWETDAGWLRLSWEELDGPQVTPPSRTGFGSRMIERTLSAESGGSAEISYRPRGVVFKAAVPLSR